MFLLSAFVSAALATRANAAAATFAGATSTFLFPPADVSATASLIDTFFPDASQVGFPSLTPTGDEAQAIATAPAVPKVNSFFPLIRPETADKKGIEFDVITSWANLSPMQSTSSLGLPGASELIPEGCQLNQVHLLHRHGARYPTTTASPAVFAATLHAAASSGNLTATGPLTFLNNWTYKLGAEIVTPFGREQLFNMGVGFRVKYGDLLKNFTGLPVWRTTSEERMVDSALHFAAGFFGVQTYQSSYHQSIIIETPGFNNSLAPDMQCPNANNAISELGPQATAAWNEIYLVNAQKRLSPHLPGFNLTIPDLSAMQTICAYETVALGYSAFCDLFTEEEWRGFEYGIDLTFWYTDGPGNPAISAQGIGWVQELVARLTQTPITNFNNAINRTLDSSNITFPLSQPIFVDASHDTAITSMLTAMNFTFAEGGPLPIDHIPEHQSYKVREQVPFGATFVGQVLSCPANDVPTHIRWILNDAVLPQTNLAGCTSDPNGLCEINTFVAAMQQRINEVDFAFDCFGNYTFNLTGDTITNGQFPK